MLFEIKPVALKAMVTAVVEDVALRTVRSVSADPVDALVIDEKDAAIGCAFNVCRLIGDVNVVSDGPGEEEVDVSVGEPSARASLPIDENHRPHGHGYIEKGRFPGIELARASFIFTNEDNNGGFVACSTAKTVWS